MQFGNTWVRHPKVQSLRANAAAYKRQLKLDRAMRRALTATTPIALDRATAGIIDAWGDPSLSIDDPYLRTLMKEVDRASGVILQCGASLFTVLVGIACHKASKDGANSAAGAKQSGAKHLWTLEHNAHWANVIRTWLNQYEISNTHVITAQVEMFGDYVWYVIDRLPDNISLLLCEGSNALPTGLRGALEQIPSRLGKRAVILARNVKRPSDLKHAHSWAKSLGAPIVVAGKDMPFVKIAKPADAAAPEPTMLVDELTPEQVTRARRAETRR